MTIISVAHNVRFDVYNQLQRYHFLLKVQASKSFFSLKMLIFVAAVPILPKHSDFGKKKTERFGI